MAEIDILHYRRGSSKLHNFDPRLKILLMIAYISVILSGSPPAWTVTSILLVPCSYSAGIRLMSIRRELKVFGFLAAVIFLSRAAGVLDTGAGAAAVTGILSAWSFLLIVWTGMVFTAVMDPRELHLLVYWIFRPVPGVSAGRLAAQASFTLVLLPLILDSAHEIREARKARGVELRKNPLKRLHSLAYPLLEKLLLRMEEFSLALEARCFDEDVLRVDFHLHWRDTGWWILYLFPAIAMLSAGALLR